MYPKKYLPISLAVRGICNYLRRPNLKTTGMAVEKLKT
jgi:hypothetical protein